MAVQTIDIPKLDPNLKTGPSRIMSGMSRFLTPTPDVYYGEFMTWIYVGTSGDISFQDWSDTTRVLTNVAAGAPLPIYTMRINSSGTTATDIVVGS